MSLAVVVELGGIFAVIVGGFLLGIAQGIIAVGVVALYEAQDL